MATCGSCSSPSPTIFSAQYFYNQQCNDCILTGCNGASQDAKCVYYNGPALPCSGIEPMDTLETVLQKIDEQICAVTGDYSTYEYNCLEDWCSCTITTEAQFVNQITAYACETRSLLEVFTGTTFPTYQAALNATFETVGVPGITCETASITPTSTLNEILQAYCSSITAIEEDIQGAIDTADWSQCIASSAPTTLLETFNLIIDQICIVKATADAAAVLPIFDNSFNCLEGTSEDTLVDTINGMLDLLCDTSPFSAEGVTWGCIDDGEATDLQEAFQVLVDNIISTQSSVITTVSEDFVLSLNDVDDPCSGLNLALASPLVNSDRLVASNAIDATPGTLMDKLSAGPNITLDDTTTPGLVIISSTGDTYKVKADISEADGDANYLTDKVEGTTSPDGAISITTSYNIGDLKTQFAPSINADALMELIFSTIENNIEWKARFCTIASTCVPGYTCTAYNISNGGDPEDTSSYAYTDCFGVAQSGSLSGGEEIDVCAIGGIIITGTLTVIDNGACPELSPTTTTTTTTAAP